MYLVVFLLLGGTSSILRTFWAEPVKKNTLYDLSSCQSVPLFQGLCTYGTKCMFAHGTNELRSSNGGGGGGQPKVCSSVLLWTILEKEKNEVKNVKRAERIKHRKKRDEKG